MAIHLIRKLEHFVRLSPDDRAVLRRLAARNLRHVAPGEGIIHEGDRPEVVNLILDGWACRYKDLEDGRRQVLAFFLPGDLCDLNMFILRSMDHSMAAITPVTLAEIARRDFEALALEHPRIVHALWWDALVVGAIQREWTLSLGQRDALERMAHLLCELFVRLRCVGMTHGDRCPLPLVQTVLADATGLSNVHVNRTLATLRQSDLATIRSRTLTIPDLDALMQAGLFNQNYLHLDREGQALDANV